MPIPLMEFLVPVLLATVLCFVAGSLLHTVLPLHRNDWRPLPDEPGVLAALARAGVTPGNYIFPHGDMAAMKDPAFQEKLTRGPCGTMTLRAPGPIAMGGYLGKQFVFHLLVSIVLAYVAGRSLPPGAAYLHIFQVVGTVAMLAYIAAIFPAAIWYSEPRHYITAKVVDGVVWGLLTAGSFAGFWPR